MLHYLLPENFNSLLAFAGIILAFAATVYITQKLADKLPKDAGRDFAHNGKLSAGKPRGAGVIFVPVFAVSAALPSTPPAQASRTIWATSLLSATTSPTALRARNTCPSCWSLPGSMTRHTPPGFTVKQASVKRIYSGSSPKACPPRR